MIEIQTHKITLFPDHPLLWRKLKFLSHSRRKLGQRLMFSGRSLRRESSFLSNEQSMGESQPQQLNPVEEQEIHVELPESLS